jgi:hypothetical protein
MTAVTLKEFLDEFLERQDLLDCTITFEPHHAKIARRAKRSNATLEDPKDPRAASFVGDGKTVFDLLEKLLSLSDELRSWTTQGNKRYIPRLWDHTGVRVKESTQKLAVARRAS